MSNIMKVKKEAWEILSLLDETDGEVTQEVAELYQKLTQSGQSAIAILADIRDELEARMEARKAKAKELTNLAKKDEQMLENNKRYMIKIMETLGINKIQVGALNVSLGKGRESVNVVDEALVPNQYKMATVTIPASDLPVIESLIDTRNVKIAVSKTLIMHEHKKSNGEIGVAGTEIVLTPSLTIKG